MGGNVEKGKSVIKDRRRGMSKHVFAPSNPHLEQGYSLYSLCWICVGSMELSCITNEMTQFLSSCQIFLMEMGTPNFWKYNHAIVISIFYSQLPMVSTTNNERNRAISESKNGNISETPAWIYDAVKRKGKKLSPTFTR